MDKNLVENPADIHRGASPGNTDSNTTTGKRLSIYDSESSGLLSLVSLDCWLDGDLYKHHNQWQQYLRYLYSSRPEIRELAALSGVLDEYSGSADQYMDNRSPFEVVQSIGEWGDAGVHDALLADIKSGALDAYSRAPFASYFIQCYTALRGPPNGPLQANELRYLMMLFTSLLQDILWDRADAFCAAVRGQDNSRANDVTATVMFEPGRHWGRFRVHNRSAVDLRGVTVSCRADVSRPESKPRPDWMPPLLGIVGSAMLGENDLNQLLAGAQAQTVTVQVASELHFMPERALVHVDNLPAGQDLVFRFFLDPPYMNLTHNAVYSLWADGVDIENQPLPGFGDQILYATGDGSPKAQAAQQTMWRERDQADPSAAEEAARFDLKEAQELLSWYSDKKGIDECKWVIHRYPETNAAKEASLLLDFMNLSYEEKLRFLQGSQSRATDPSRPYLGVWSVLAFEYRNRRIDPPRIWSVREDGTILETIPGVVGHSMTYKYSVGDSALPKTIDLTPLAGQSMGTVLHSILKVEGDLLTVCMPRPGEGDPASVTRPTEFDVSRSNEIQMVRLKRIN